MTATGVPYRPATVATLRIDFDVFDRECALRGATDETARARLAGVDRATLWRWRNGRYTPSLSAITRIAQRFDLSVDELIQREAA